MKAPTFNPRETEVFEHADRLVMRVLINNHWRQTIIFPTENQSLKDRLLETRLALKNLAKKDPTAMKVLIYAGAEFEDGLRIAIIPNDFIPQGF